MATFGPRLIQGDLPAARLHWRDRAPTYIGPTEFDNLTIASPASNSSYGLAACKTLAKTRGVILLTRRPRRRRFAGAERGLRRAVRLPRRHRRDTADDATMPSLNPPQDAIEKQLNEPTNLRHPPRPGSASRAPPPTPSRASLISAASSGP